MLIRVLLPILLVVFGHESDDHEHTDDLTGSSSSEDDNLPVDDAMPTEKPTFAKITKATPDDGQYNAQIDLPVDCRTSDTWETCPEWTCPVPFSNIGENVETSYLEVTDQKHDFGGHKSNMNEDSNQETLYPNSGYPKGIPHSGYHRPKWPQYGEYKYIPPLRFVHALEHGSILFLYHPCTPVELVQKLRSVARGCLWKHLIFSFRGDLNEDYPMAMVSYGTIFRINKIDSTSLPVIREWIRTHAKIGAGGEGRVFGDGTYTLLQVHTAEIVTEIEDSEICPGNDTLIDDSKFNYFDLAQTWSPIQESEPTQVESHDDISDQSEAGNQSRATIQQILNRHNSLGASPEAALPASSVSPTHTVPVVEILDQGHELETVLATETSSSTIQQSVVATSSTVASSPVENPVSATKMATSTTSTPTSKMHIILAEGKTFGPTTTTFSSDEEALPSEEPSEESPEDIIVPVEPEARDEELEDAEEKPEDVATTVLPTTTSSTPRLIVGTPPADTAVPNSPNYSLDDNYDGSLYESDGLGSDPEVDLDVAKQETLVEIKKSESFWAFLSCAVLIIGLSLAAYKSQLCLNRKRGGYIRNSENWSDDEQSMSVGTLVRNLRRKTSIDETKYSLLKNAEDEV